ncbi:MarP family serine protease [Planosporangium sp. 12N6]|uniref:MarP family serine protease n=1 Tax=Planosporangium spinosum TaxID=3402278 RepID=UPI003CF7E33B
MPGTLVDLLLVGLMLVFALNGYRQGFLIGLMSFIGFFGGALIGLQLGPLIAQRFADDPVRVLVSLAAVFGLAAVGQGVAGFVGAKLREAVSSQSARHLDDLGGALVSVVAVLLVVWLVAAPLGSSSLPWLARAVKNSAILGTVDRVMPGEAKALSGALRQTVDTRGFPDVFGGLTPTRVREVPEPDPALASSPLVANSRSSVVKVLGTAPSCSRRIEGSGFIYSPEHVMTNAHVVAGTRNNTVEVNGVRRAAQVVVYDPRRDLAVLYVPGVRGPVMKFGGPAQSGADAVVLGYPLDGPFDARSARVRDLRDITGPDIYNAGKVTREVYTLKGLVRSGNSGGPMVGTDGTVLGVIFAAAADDPQTGFAVTAEEASPVAVAGQARTQPVDTGDCAD